MTNKFKSFGCDAVQIDGHNLKKIYKSITSKNLNKPKVIVANTIKGKGFSFSENNKDWHHKIMTKEMYELGLKELNEQF